MKFKTIDEEYFRRRKVFADKYGARPTFSSTDYWPLYVGFGNLARYIALLDIIKESLNVPGSIAEFGVYKGAGLMFIAKVMHLMDPMGWKEIHGFDSFEGLTTFTDEDGDATKDMGRFAGSYEELLELIDLHELQDEVNLHKGLIQDTLPPLLESHPELRFSLVFCDTDLYEPTKLIMDSLHDRLSVGGMFVCDEWNYEPYPGETQAIQEFMEKHGDCYRMRHPRNTRNPTLILEKVKF